MPCLAPLQLWTVAEQVNVKRGLLSGTDARCPSNNQNFTKAFAYALNCLKTWKVNILRTVKKNYSPGVDTFPP